MPIITEPCLNAKRTVLGDRPCAFVDVERVPNTYLVVHTQGYVSADSFDDFYLTWQRYDPMATQFVDYYDLRDFLEELPPPMGFPDGCNDSNVAELAIPLYIDTMPRKTKRAPTPKAHCVDVLDALVQKQSGASQAESDKEKRRAQDLQAKMDEKLRAKFPKRVVYGKPASNTKSYHNATMAAKKIQQV